MCNKYCGTFFGAIGILLLSGAIYMGAFQYTEAYLTFAKPITFVFKSYQVDYKNLGTIVKDTLAYLGSVAPLQGKKVGYMGFYYDNPNWVEEGSFPRSDIGFYSMVKLSPEIIEQLKKDNFNIALLPESKILQVQFPWKNNFSMLFALMKAYTPIIERIHLDEYKYLWKGNGTPFIECIIGSWYYLSIPLENIDKFWLTPMIRPPLTLEGKSYLENLNN